MKSQHLINVCESALGEKFYGRVGDKTFTVWKSRQQKEGQQYLFHVPGHGESGKGYPTENAAIAAAKSVISSMKGN
jgi:hypothetical protein